MEILIGLIIGSVLTAILLLKKIDFKSEHVVHVKHEHIMPELKDPDLIEGMKAGPNAAKRDAIYTDEMRSAIQDINEILMGVKKDE